MPKISLPVIDLNLTVEFRLAQEDDLPKLEWEGEYTHFRRVIRQTYREQRVGRRAMLVAVVNGYPVGQIYLLFKDDQNLFHNDHHCGYLYAFRVMMPFRNLGIGSALVQGAEEILRARHITQAIISVGRDNPRARELYERLGYTVYAEDEGEWSYVNHQGKKVHMIEPCWMLSKDLTIMLE